MPIAVERNIKRSVRKAHPNYSEKRVNKETYSTMNKLGILHNRAGGPEKLVPKGKYVHAAIIVAIVLIIAHFISGKANVSTSVPASSISAPGEFSLGVGA